MTKNSGLNNDYQAFLGEYGLSPEGLDETVDELHASYERLLLGKKIDVPVQHPFGEALNIIEQVLESRSDSLPENILFCVYPTGQFNAFCKSTEHGTLILINRGLISALRGISKYISVAVTEGSEDEFEFPNPVELPENRALQRCLVNSVESTIHYLNGQPTRYPRATSYDAGEWRAFLGTHLSLAMETFVAAHELAHIKLGHLKNEKPQNQINFQEILDVLRQSQPEEYDANLVAALNRVPSKEYEADLFAQDILKEFDEIHASRKRFPWPFIIGGPYFLTIGVFIQMVNAKLQGIPFNEHAISEGHPAPSDRTMKLLTNQIETQTQDQLGQCSGLFRGISSLVRIMYRADIQKEDESTYRMSFKDSDLSLAVQV